ncbi:hypothetical protein M441DRAFT_44910 [Trichoderma asperellum CBS 433.97]|uniref:Uncharacterized protein n=1 Tax=Trichoderma asperellum (strain ATCC 204424 / CBS 433.97 / NBRC 101777) TaxID=1042311 RepID=A0A2T3ZDI4_TRIA4|nr:hypothetical protein M441DRAFT_44910 [Trichoderma asperellum CBS 433.97]PTB42868.1 hypothetical protein M441DRAFT_44910 [Trichoderma asperellum CBS 433.97]
MSAQPYDDDGTAWWQRKGPPEPDECLPDGALDCGKRKPGKFGSSDKNRGHQAMWVARASERERQWLLPGTREKYLSRESLPRVSRVYCHASRLLAGATPPWSLLASVPALSASSHSQRPHHRLLLPARPPATATPAAPPVAALQTQPDPLHVSLRARLPAQEQPRGGPWAQIVLAGRFTPTPPPPHFDAKYIARSLAGLHQP